MLKEDHNFKVAAREKRKSINPVKDENPSRLFANEVVQQFTNGKLKPFLNAKPLKPEELHKVFSERPMLKENKFYLKTLPLKTGDEAKESATDTAPADLLQDGIHEVQVLRETDSDKIPWDNGTRSGIRAYVSGDYDRALYYFSSISEQKSCGACYMLRGIANFKAGHFGKAEVEFTNSLERVDADAYAFFNRGVTRSNLNKMQGAIDDFTMAISLKPKERKFFHNRGLVYRRLGQYCLAEKDYFAINPHAIANSESSELSEKKDEAKMVLSALKRSPDLRTPEDIELLSSKSVDKKVLEALTRTELFLFWGNCRYTKILENQRLPLVGDRLNVGLDEESQDVLYYIWSGDVSKRRPAENIHPNILANQIRSSQYPTLGKFDLLTKILGEGDVIGYDEGRARGRFFYVTEKESEFLIIDRILFKTIIQPVVMSGLTPKYLFLRELACFKSGWEKADLQALASDIQEITYEKDMDVITQGLPACSLYFVVFGVAAVLKTLSPQEPYGKNKTICIGRLMSGDIFSERALVNTTSAISPITIRSETKLKVYKLDVVQVCQELWNPMIIKALRSMSFVIPEENKLLQYCIDQESWLFLKKKILFGSGSG